MGINKKNVSVVVEKEREEERVDYRGEMDKI
jgi:hypothetical protein